ncbi:MAG: hypothetical protein A2293_02985 [Elusimicrobia bacterium RIFOXYB2_FULL_49_7]|nr:MAG: hypothetical protein A2293_02985 [Elusimicrobia bacterium RIFOXYB2_FULL_49_7]
MVNCPSCQSRRIHILDKGLKKVVRFFQGNNRFACRDCGATWREREPHLRLKLKRKRQNCGTV